MRTFSLVNPRMVQSSARYDLLVDGAAVLTEVLYDEALEYALQNAADDDDYREDGFESGGSGRQLRAEHNSMERSFANMPGTYEPKYHPSPTTGEVEFQADFLV